MSIKSLPLPVAGAIPPERVLPGGLLLWPGVWSLKVGPAIKVGLDNCEDFRSQVSVPALLLPIRSIQTGLLSEGTRQLLPTPGAAFRLLPVKNDSNKPITPSCGNQGAPHPFGTTRPASHSPWLFTLPQSASPMWP